MKVGVGKKAGDAYDKIYSNSTRREEGCLREYFFQVEDRLVVEGIAGECGQVLDIGTGNGRMFKPIAQLGGFSCVGIDLSREGILKAARNFPRASFLVADASALPLKGETVDFVVAVGVFEMPGVLAAVLDDVSRVLRNDGEFRFTCWNAERWYGGRVFDRKMDGSIEYSFEDLQALLRGHGFEIYQAKTTFFIPRKIFWGLYALLFFEPIRCFFLTFCAWLDTIFIMHPRMRHKGWEWVIVARKSSETEV